MKKILKLIFGKICLFWPVIVSAQVELGAPMLEKKTVREWPEYVSLIYRTALLLAAVLAVLMLIYGGYKYMMSAGNPEALGEAKEIITGTIIALILLILAGLLLRTISPNIVSFT